MLSAFTSQGSHAGKIVLSAAPVADAAAEGVTIVTGGTGGLGAHVAAWLAGIKVHMLSPRFMVGRELHTELLMAFGIAWQYLQTMCHAIVQGCRRICLVGRTGHARALAGGPLHAAFTGAAVVTVARCDAASQDEVACLLDAVCENAKQPPVQVCTMSLLSLLRLPDRIKVISLYAQIS